MSILASLVLGILILSSFAQEAKQNIVDGIANKFQPPLSEQERKKLYQSTEVKKYDKNNNNDRLITSKDFSLRGLKCGKGFVISDYQPAIPQEESIIRFFGTERSDSFCTFKNFLFLNSLEVNASFDLISGEFGNLELSKVKVPNGLVFLDGEVLYTNKYNYFTRLLKRIGIENKKFYGLSQPHPEEKADFGVVEILLLEPFTLMNAKFPSQTKLNMDVRTDSIYISHLKVPAREVVLVNGFPCGSKIGFRSDKLEYCTLMSDYLIEGGLRIPSGNVAYTSVDPENEKIKFIYFGPVVKDTVVNGIKLRKGECVGIRDGKYIQKKGPIDPAGENCELNDTNDSL